MNTLNIGDIDLKSILPNQHNQLVNLIYFLGKRV